jgi:hypothetical protein
MLEETLVFFFRPPIMWLKVCVRASKPKSILFTALYFTLDWKQILTFVTCIIFHSALHNVWNYLKLHDNNQLVLSNVGFCKNQGPCNKS